MITWSKKGSFRNLERFLKNAKKAKFHAVLARYGELGVSALSAATPVESGVTSSSWEYEVDQTGDTASIYWYNTHENQGVNIAIILYYGHATKNGYFVSGRDYIRGPMRPVMDQIAEDVWKEVTSL